MGPSTLPLETPGLGLATNLKVAQFPNSTIPSTSLLGQPAAAPLVTYALTDYRPHAPNHGRVAFACNTAWRACWIYGTELSPALI